MNDLGYILAYEATVLVKGEERSSTMVSFYKGTTGFLGGTFEDTDQADKFMVRLHFKRVNDIDQDFVTQLDLPKGVRRIRIPLIMALVMGIGGE